MKRISFDLAVRRKVTTEIVKNSGFKRTTDETVDFITDVVEAFIFRFISDMKKTAEASCRQRINLEDLFLMLPKADFSLEDMVFYFDRNQSFTFAESAPMYPVDVERNNRSFIPRHPLLSKEMVEVLEEANLIEPEPSVSESTGLDLTMNK
ncbi:hypothetical protein FO519_004506 [Halicephalobus sp. NKZ332]|nr:hypothetical protein FO519_004506 [Halicephalobus sp. NKZ332]